MGKIRTTAVWPQKHASFLIVIIAFVGMLIGSTAGSFFYLHKNQSAMAAGMQHYFYVFSIGNMYVYDMDNNHQLINTVSLPIKDVRGALASATTGMLYISHGGTGGIMGAGALLKYNLLTNSVVWNIPFSSGVDYMAITPDGQTIYLADGDQNPDGKWYVLDANTGTIKTTIIAAAGAHNAVMSPDGKYVYFGGTQGNNFYQASTATNQIIQQIPTPAPVRPFTVNAEDTYAFVNETGLIGFQIMDLKAGKVLYTVQPPAKYTAISSTENFSHGISLSPDEKQIYLMDAPNDVVHVFDVSGLPTIAPTDIADIQLSPITGTQSPCNYDCQKEGWVQHSLDGRYVYAADSGDVISTATHQIVTTLPQLANSRISIEVDWNNGKVVNAGTRISVGQGFGSTGSPPPVPVPSNGVAIKGPVNTNWNFAEGRVGKGFREYLTIGNPDPVNACVVSIQYHYSPDGGVAMNKTVTVPIAAGSRATESVNSDLGFDSAGGSAAVVATTVSVTNTASGCTGVMVERPIYFSNYHGMSSGTDVIGATQLGTNFYFADIPAGANATSYLTILNPGTSAANITVSYAANGQVTQQTATVAAGSRGTIPVNSVVSADHVAATVTASAPVLVERPSYIANAYGLMGAADIVGVGALANDWLFAEGYTGGGFQENLTIANLDPTNATASVSIILKSQTGATQTFPVTVNAHSQLIWNVDQNNTFASSTPEVSAEVTSSGANIVVQREIYFLYHHTLSNGTVEANGITDVLGQVGPASKSAYTFAEGYSNTGYSEWLTLQNPSASAETITVSMVNGNHAVCDQTFSVGANSRYTFDVSAVVLSYMTIPNNTPSFEVSMTVQSSNGAVFVAERPMYWNTANSAYVINGGSDVLGYTG
jgi:DNA-binding beta-propeller fold protein YncE